MRHLAVLLAISLLVACSTSPATRSPSQAERPAEVLTPELQEASIDSPVQFLLAVAATDFHAMRAPPPARFRDVHIGYIMDTNGAKQYMLCGQFLPAQGGDEIEWTPFTTIKTEGYEQWLGAQAAGLCQRPSIVWDKELDLSSSLERKLDSLK